MAMKFNATQKKQFEKLLDAYEQARDELVAFAREVHDEWECEANDKSERWQESEAGQEATERVEALSDFADELDNDTPDYDAFFGHN